MIEAFDFRPDALIERLPGLNRAGVLEAHVDAFLVACGRVRLLGQGIEDLCVLRQRPFAERGGLGDGMEILIRRGGLVNDRGRALLGNELLPSLAPRDVPAVHDGDFGRLEVLQSVTIELDFLWRRPGS